ncbi:hypothetical protein C8R44DRAFT_750342 [Mycena epipterygia]|nr:hypothetical protein C8R44DRAFT_750342 [Mycena epipterygia]
MTDPDRTGLPRSIIQILRHVERVHTSAIRFMLCFESRWMKKRRSKPRNSRGILHHEQNFLSYEDDANRFTQDLSPDRTGIPHVQRRQSMWSGRAPALSGTVGRTPRPALGNSFGITPARGTRGGRETVKERGECSGVLREQRLEYRAQGKKYPRRRVDPSQARCCSRTFDVPEVRAAAAMRHGATRKGGDRIEGGMDEGWKGNGKQRGAREDVSENENRRIRILSPEYLGADNDAHVQQNERARTTDDYNTLRMYADLPAEEITSCRASGRAPRGSGKETNKVGGSESLQSKIGGGGKDSERAAGPGRDHPTAKQCHTNPCLRPATDPHFHPLPTKYWATTKATSSAKPALHIRHICDNLSREETNPAMERRRVTKIDSRKGIFNPGRDESRRHVLIDVGVEKYVTAEKTDPCTMRGGIHLDSGLRESAHKAFRVRGAKLARERWWRFPGARSEEKKFSGTHQQ